MERPGALVKSTRREAGLTQAQLAIRAGTTQSAISRLERDDYSPTVDALNAIFAAMGYEFHGLPERRKHGESIDQLRRTRELSYAKRLNRALRFNRVAREMYEQGRRLRGER